MNQLNRRNFLGLSTLALSSVSAASIEVDAAEAISPDSAPKLIQAGSQFVTVTDFGAIGNGVAADQAAFVNAAAGVTKTIHIPPEIYRIAANITLPKGVEWIFMNGARLKIDPGVTVVFRGVARAGITQIFEGDIFVAGKGVEALGSCDQSGGVRKAMALSTTRTHFKPRTIAAKQRMTRLA